MAHSVRVGTGVGGGTAAPMVLVKDAELSAGLGSGVSEVTDATSTISSPSDALEGSDAPTL